MAADLIDRARNAVQDRAELPGMSLMEHLEELRRRLLWSAAWLAIGMAVAWAFHNRLIAIIQKPLRDIGLSMTMTHPTDAINLFIKTALVFGAIFASPFILYQVWLFISPGMYANEKRYVLPFLGATVFLFLAGAWFGYRYVLPGAMVVLIQDFGKNFTHMITIEDYTGFFLAVILGLGVCFELPIVIFFLALFGIVDGKFLLKHFRYAILAIFVIAAVICPSPEPVAMCLFASPMLVLYGIGIGVAFMVHPARRKKKKENIRMTFRRLSYPAKNPGAPCPDSRTWARHCLRFAALLLIALPSTAQKPAKNGISGEHVMALTRQLLAVAPKRFIGSPGHAAAENFIKAHFAPEIAHGQFETDEFHPSTPIGQVTMRNYIVRYPGKKDGVIVIASHYETNYWLKDIGFVGANDGACTTALLIAMGEYFRVHPPQGYSVWLVFDDGEEAIKSWSASDSLYGTRHLAAKWSGDGTLRKIKAFLVADMIGDKDLNIDHVDNSTPWLLDDLKTAARDTGHAANVFRYSEAEEDDHLPFVMRGVPSLDVLDAHYGPSTDASPDGFHHTAQDTIDKISAHSLQISADIFLDLIRLIDQR